MSSTTPANNWKLLVKSDTVALNPAPSSLYVLTTGNLALQGGNGNVEIFPVVAGHIYPLRPSRLMLTGTTATCIAIYNTDFQAS